MKLFVDIESFHDSKNGYGLKAMSMVEYIRDNRFAFQGLGYAVDDLEPRWVAKNDIPGWVGSIDWGAAEVIAQNSKFDLFALVSSFSVEAKLYIDTKAMARAVLGKTVKSYSLKDLAEHFGLPAKGQLKTDGLSELTEEQEKELAEYCCHDVWLCREIFNRLNKDFPASQYEAMDWTIRSFVNPKLVLNVPLLEQTNKQEAERREAIFKDIGIPKETFASNVKFPKLLEEKGYVVPKKVSGRTGKSISALALGDVGFIEMASTADPELKKLCEARIAAKSTLLETRSLALANIGKTGPWPFDVEFSGATQTHRFSGGGGAGGNPQNFTRGSALRDAVEAPEGYKLIVGDFSNIELRIVAYLSKDPGLIQAIEQGKDLYCDFGSAFFGRTITKADKWQRHFSKCAILGLQYNMGPKRFKATVKVQTDQDISEEDATRAVNLYRRRYTKVPALWDKLQALIPYITTGVSLPDWMVPVVEVDKEALILPSGLKLRFPGLRQEGSRRGQPEWVYDVWRKKEEKETTKLYGGKVLENISQALAGELCKEVLVRMKDKCVGQVHDELHLLEKAALAHVTAARLKREMETSPSWLPEMKLAAEVKIGKSWGDCK